MFTLLRSSLLFCGVLVAVPALAARPTVQVHFSGVGTATVRYDDTGSPHVTAPNLRAGYAGLCWATAQDRLFQLDLFRRAAEGRVAEIFGAEEGVLEDDVLIRVLGVSAEAKERYAETAAATKTALEGCATGINKAIATAKQQGTLPLEFSVLGYEPEDWKPYQSIAIAVYVAASFDLPTVQTKLQHSAIASLLSPEIAEALVPAPYVSPSMFDAQGNLNPPQEFLAVAAPARSAQGLERQWALKGLPGAAPRLPTLLGNTIFKGLKASNNFAVDGRKSTTGRPLVANDLHLSLTTPGFLYQAQLQVSGEFNVAGFFIPGVPAFLSGHNAVSTWAVTFSQVDAADVFLETLNADGTKVKFKGAFVPLTYRTETFNVAGGAPVTKTVRVTPHGPVMNDALPVLDAFGVLAIQTVFAQSAWKLDGFFKLPSARSWTEFRTALRTESIGMNFLFADTQGSYGHIGYQLAATVPVRRAENFVGLVPGDSGAFDWNGYVAFEQLPKVFDPSTGFLVTANNRLVPPDYAPNGTVVWLGEGYDEAWRAQRAYRLISSKPKLSARDLADIQLDTKNVFARSVGDLLVAAVERAGLPANDPDAAASLQAVRTWDGMVNKGSKGAVVFEMWLAVLARDTALNVIGPDLYPGYAEQVFQSQQFHGLIELLKAPVAPFFGATGPGNAQAKRDQAVRRALAEADELLRTALGNDDAAWRWGGLHTLTYNHPLATTVPEFAIGTFAHHGDVATLNIGGWFTSIGLLALPPAELAAAGGAQAAFAQDAVPAMRVVWDTANFNRSLSVLSTGVSGDPASPHWKDQAAQWRAGTYNQVPFD
jgi:penicillin G amidase